MCGGCVGKRHLGHSFRSSNSRVSRAVTITVPGVLSVVAASPSPAPAPTLHHPAVGVFISSVIISCRHPGDLRLWLALEITVISNMKKVLSRVVSTPSHCVRRVIVCVSHLRIKRRSCKYGCKFEWTEMWVSDKGNKQRSRVEKVNLANNRFKRSVESLSWERLN